MYWCHTATCHTLVMRCNLWTHCLPDQWVPTNNNMKLHSHVNSAPHPFPMSHDYRHQLGQVHNEWLDKYKKTMLGICARALFFMTTTSEYLLFSIWMKTSSMKTGIVWESYKKEYSLGRRCSLKVHNSRSLTSFCHKAEGTCNLASYRLNFYI